MNKLMNVFRMSLFVSLLIIFLAVTFGIYLPMKNELTKELNEKFSNNAKLSKKAIDNFLKRCIQGAESLSSRTMIRKMIVEYLSGNITFKELQKYTAPKYLDGANVLQNLKRATRIVSGNIIASVGSLDNLDIGKAISCEDVSETTLDIEFENQFIVVNVCSPIRENTTHNFVFMTSSRGRNGENATVIGHDLVSFDMTKLLDEINTGNIVYEIYIATNSKYISSKGKTFDVLKDDTLGSNEKITWYTMKIGDTDAFLVASILNDIIYAHIKKLALLISIIIAATFLTVILLTYFAILTNARKMIKTMEQDNIKIKELERLKSEFLATMSHELRTPLNSIIGFVSMILQGISGDINEEQRKQLSMVHSSSIHLLNLINDILDISKIEAGKMSFSKDRFNIKDVISEVVQNVSPLISKKEVKLITEIPDEIPEVYSDKTRVFQILLNLVSNAIKFTEKGEIRIKCEVDGDKLKISVSDTGKGIKEEDMETLFEAFRQISGSARRRYQGAGLGLYLSKKLVTLLGGEIWVESEYGKGSTFTFTLPLKSVEENNHEEKSTGDR